MNDNQRNVSLPSHRFEGIRMAIVRIMAMALLLAVITPANLNAQSFSLPWAKLKLNSKQVKKVKSNATNIWNDANKKKEIPQSKIDEMLASYAEVEAKSPAEQSAAALLMSEAYAKMGDRDNQMKYLLVAESKMPENAQTLLKLATYIDLGWNYFRGTGASKDENKALDYFVKAYETDSVGGALPMAMVNIYGIGTNTVDLNSAANYLMQSDNGIRWPMIYAINYYLDNLEKNPNIQKGWEDYLEGYRLFTIDADTEKAIPVLDESINAGFIPANQLLADLYLEKGDQIQAMALVEPAVQTGYEPALHQKAWYIYRSAMGKIGQQKTIAEAYDLFRMAADAGFPPSQATVAELHLVGSAGVVKVDNELAYKYAVAAEKAGEPLGKVFAERAQKAMTSERIQGLVDALNNVKVSVYYYRILSLQNKYKKQAEQARKERQGEAYEEPGDNANDVQSGGSSASSNLTKAYNNNWRFYNYSKYYRNAISKVITIEVEMSGKNLKGYTKKDLEAAKRNARETREKGNSYATHGNSIPKSKYED